MATGPEFTYLRPGSLDEALEQKARLGGKARFIFGGTDVMVQRRAGVSTPEALISLRRLPELAGISQADGLITIGAGTTLTDLLQDETIAARLPILRQAAQVMGCTQMRNVATIGGNVMSAVSSGDTIPPLICLDASAVLAGADGVRRLPLDGFFTGPRKTAAGDDEVLLALEVPEPAADAGGAYIKLGRRAALDLAVVGIAALVRLDGAGKISHARLAAGAVGPTPLRLHAAEAAIAGKQPDDGTFAAAAEAALGETSPWDDVRASRWYRQEMIKVILPRTLRQALDAIGEGQRS